VSGIRPPYSRREPQAHERRCRTHPTPRSGATGRAKHHNLRPRAVHNPASRQERKLRSDIGNRRSGTLGRREQRLFAAFLECAACHGVETRQRGAWRHCASYQFKGPRLQRLPFAGQFPSLPALDAATASNATTAIVAIHRSAPVARKPSTPTTTLAMRSDMKLTQLTNPWPNMLHCRRPSQRFIGIFGIKTPIQGRMLGE